MIITNQNSSLQLKLDNLETFLNAGSSDSNICIKSTINCCDTLYTKTIKPTGYWEIDLSERLDFDIQSITFKNIKSNINFVVPVRVRILPEETIFVTPSSFLFNMTTGECDTPLTVTCLTDWLVAEIEDGIPSGIGSGTVEDFSITLTNIRIALNNYFTSIGVYDSNINVSAVDNVLRLSNFPEDCVPYLAHFEPDADNLFFYYGSNKGIFIYGDSIHILPEFFGFTSFSDGIYYFEAIGYDGKQYFKEVNAAFVDIETGQKVATTIGSLVQETTKRLLKDKASDATYIHLLHYGLVISSNTGCNYQDLCTGFKELVGLLNSTNSQRGIRNECGCSR